MAVVQIVLSGREEGTTAEVQTEEDTFVVGRLVQVSEIVCPEELQSMRYVSHRDMGYSDAMGRVSS